MKLSIWTRLDTVTSVPGRKALARGGLSLDLMLDFSPSDTRGRKLQGVAAPRLRRASGCFRPSALPTWMDPASQGEGRGPGAEEKRSSRVCRRKRHRAKRLLHQSPVTGGCLRRASRCLRPQAPLAVGPAVTLGQERPRGPSCQLPPFPCSLTTHSTHLLGTWKDQNVTRVPASLSL